MRGTMHGPIDQQIRERISQCFGGCRFELINESDSHSGPPGRESHFKLVLIFDGFLAESRLARQRRVYQALTGLIPGTVHALSLYTYTEEEWLRLKPDPQSPLCAHGKKP